MASTPIAFDVAGPEHAPTLMLLHGSVVTRTMWGPQLCDLSDEYRVIAPDLPGHGALAHLPFSFSYAVRVLADLIQQEGNGLALVAGLSLGGYVAIELAHHHPELVKGLVLSGCRSNFRGGLGLYLKIVSALMENGWLQQNRDKIERKTRALFPPSLASLAEAQIQAGLYPEALGSAFAEMAGQDFATLLARYPGPVLVLNGEHDVPARRAKPALTKDLDRVQVRVVPKAGHACSFEQPDVYTSEIRAFARSIDRSPSGGWRDAPGPDS